MKNRYLGPMILIGALSVVNEGQRAKIPTVRPGVRRIIQPMYVTMAPVEFRGKVKI